jgi:hypothetical protein
MIEVLKQLVEALELPTDRWNREQAIKVNDAIKVGLKAIRDLEKQEPVAMRYDFDGYGFKYIDAGSGSDWQTRIEGAEPLYASPQPRKPLALEHLRLYWKHAQVFDELHVEVGFPDYLLLVRDTESQHGINND